MTYTGKCPHCGTVLRSGHGDPWKRIGKPIRFCPKCGRPYIDNNYYEWNVISPLYKFSYYYFANNRFVLWLIAPIIGFSSQSFFSFLVFTVLLIICCPLWVLLSSGDEIFASARRTSDQEYKFLLVKMGYDKIDMQHELDYRDSQSRKSSVKPQPSEPQQSPPKQNTPPQAVPSSSSSHSNSKSDYQWKFEYACVVIVFLIVGLLFSWTKCSKAERHADQLEQQIESIESENYDRGYKDGRRDGYDIGYDEGRSDGSQKKYDEGYDQGYLYGYAFGIKDSINGELKEMTKGQIEWYLFLADEENRN